MQIGQSVFRINKLVLEHWEITQILPKQYKLSRKDNGEVKIVTDIMGNTEEYFLSEIVVLNTYKERLEEALRVTNEKIQEKREKFLTT